MPLLDSALEDDEAGSASPDERVAQVPGLLSTCPERLELPTFGSVPMTGSDSRSYRRFARGGLVVVEFLLGRGATVTALTAELTGARDEALHAPDLIEPESLKALRGLQRGGVIHHEKRLTTFDLSSKMFTTFGHRRAAW
jgi:hypothetical protein